jgi:hypothetical protein
MTILLSYTNFPGMHHDYQNIEFREDRLMLELRRFIITDGLCLNMTVQGIWII